MNEYFDEISIIAQHLKTSKEIEEMLDILRHLKGRLFILGVGGSAANASHAVNDFRKIAGIETYTATDNVAELTARTNDDGWDSTFINWLHINHLSSHDAVMVFSVGGGNDTTSKNIALAVGYAKNKEAKILGIVSRDGGVTKQFADACVLIPVINPQNITPHAESFQEIIWHYLANNIR